LDCRRVVFSQGYFVHAVKLEDQVAIFAAQSQRGVAVAAAFWGYLDAELGAARDGGLDLAYGCGHRDCGGSVGEALVEWRYIFRVGAGVGGVYGDADRIKALQK
jgi:hypothetical protein